MENVIEVQADCDELTYIEMNFGNIPIARKKQVVTIDERDDSMRKSDFF